MTAENLLILKEEDIDSLSDEEVEGTRVSFIREWSSEFAKGLNYEDAPDVAISYALLELRLNPLAAILPNTSDTGRKWRRAVTQARKEKYRAMKEALMRKAYSLETASFEEKGIHSEEGWFLFCLVASLPAT